MMKNLNPNLSNFLFGGLGYLAGAVAGFLIIWLAGSLGIVSWLFNLIDQDQILVRVLAIPVLAGLMLALAGGVLGGCGGWVLGAILGTPRRWRLAIGSAISFGVSISLLILVYLLLTSFISLYNNVIRDTTSHYLVIFGLYGLVFGLLTGLLQAFMTVRLRDAWRVFLAALAGFTLGGVVMGLLVRLVNPTAGFQTHPVLTGAILLLALAAPFFFGGGAFGYTYGRLARRDVEAGRPAESTQPSIWQLGIVGVIGILVAFAAIGFIEQAASFLTINPADLQSQIPPVTVGVRFSKPQTLQPDLPEDVPPEARLVPAGDGSGALIWVQGTGDDAEVLMQMPSLNEAGEPAGWAEPVNVSNSPGSASSLPQSAGSAGGEITLTWLEGDPSSDPVVYFSVCDADACLPPERLAEMDGEAFIGGPPAVARAADQTLHLAWCSSEGLINYKKTGKQAESIPFPGCSSTPAIALDGQENPHVVWYTSEISDVNDVTRPASLLVESIRTDAGWSEAATAAPTEGETLPSMAGDPVGNLHLVWGDPDETENYSVQEAYTCSPDELNAVQRAGLQALLDGEFRPAGMAIPYCRNEYRRILYTPNPEPEFSAEPATQNGAFDYVSEIANQAQYEILFTTMQYEPNSSPPSPGTVLAEEIGKLYDKIKADPQAYPRGLTVRILLGNYPVISNLEWGSQIWDALGDLRAAGVDKMVDPEIGWRLEIANYPGVYPHSHTKFLVIDGKLVVAAGFNYGYLHFSKDHPSGKGYDLLDLGLAVQGPVAQDVIGVYDDMWNGADQVHCENLNPPDGGDWRDTCTEMKAAPSHLPEVLRTFLPPEGDANAFSLYRSWAYKLGDEFIATSLAAAEKSIDMMEVNFSLEMICMVNLIFPDVCTIENALPWMDATLDAIETNGAKLRVIMENTNSNGMENRVAGRVLLDELERRGLSHLAELRFYNGKIHAKSVLFDDQFLIIGSQNMHYSAWGEGGLNEFSISTDDPAAIAEYQALYEAKWEESTPFEEAEFGTSP